MFTGLIEDVGTVETVERRATVPGSASLRGWPATSPSATR